MGIVGLHHAGIHVADLERSIAFYHDIFGLDVTEQLPIEVQPNDENRRYLAAKRDKLGHKLHHQGLKFESEGE